MTHTLFRFQILLSKVVQVDVVRDSGSRAEAEAEAIRRANNEYGGADMDCEVIEVESIPVEEPNLAARERAAAQPSAEETTQ